MDDVVAVVPQSDLIAAEFLGEIKELLAPIPGAEETGRLLFE
jgi:hypothetical protein